MALAASIAAALVALVACVSAYLWRRQVRRMHRLAVEAKQEAAYWRLQAAIAARDLPYPHDPRTAEPPGE